ncbi:MAG: serine/threonine-protein phosphatase [Cyanothece sp. SIO1E1]|nr:serine/threonine-protein phosphatase [Cyanothece sp. SIO1E1]
MSNSEPQLQCLNPDCQYLGNPPGQRACIQCQTPLYHYLWAVGTGVERCSIGSTVNKRYHVVAPQIWLDTKPGAVSEFSPDLLAQVKPYLHAYTHRLHVPEVYGVCSSPDSDSEYVLLLENAPIDVVGSLYPSLEVIWPQASTVRQAYWLWQILQLWQPLAALNVASSLLRPDNLRVEGWRVRLCQLDADSAIRSDRVNATAQSAQNVSTATSSPSDQKSSPTLQDLADCWLTWLPATQPQLMRPLQDICQQMQVEDVSLESISAQLNQCLLEQTAQLPLQISIAGGTSTGPQRSQNEDACYPNSQELTGVDLTAHPLLPHLAIVCDGIGGHEGGEVASQLVVRSLRLQLKALLAEVAEQTEPLSPKLVKEQLGAVIRVVNNLIAEQNDEQGRADRQRMGTTLMMALQLPQKIQTASGWSNTHELYLASVGDSRAYWITPNYCQLLTVDDTIATREVLMGRSLYREALKRTDAAALTQALGTREAKFVEPHIQRFLIEEDGLLLLCSDGLSDGSRVEQSWANYVGLVVKGMISLEASVQSWVELANQKNGHDNVSVVLMYYHVSPDYPQLAQPGTMLDISENASEPEMTEASKALLYGEIAAEEEGVAIAPERHQATRLKPRDAILRLLVLLLLLGSIGAFAWWRISQSNEKQAPSTPEFIEE